MYHFEVRVRIVRRFDESVRVQVVVVRHRSDRARELERERERERVARCWPLQYETSADAVYAWSKLHGAPLEGALQGRKCRRGGVEHVRGATRAETAALSTTDVRLLGSGRRRAATTSVWQHTRASPTAAFIFHNRPFASSSSGALGTPFRRSERSKIVHPAARLSRCGAETELAAHFRCMPCSDEIGIGRAPAIKRVASSLLPVRAQQKSHLLYSELRVVGHS